MSVPKNIAKIGKSIKLSKKTALKIFFVLKYISIKTQISQ